MEFKAYLVSWNEIEEWCKKLRDKIIDSYKPDIIIALSRGGLVPGRILSDMLWIKDLVAVKTEHWGVTATRDGKATLKDPGSLDLSGKNVLIVDDITDTGQSMKLAYDYVVKQQPKALKTAVMLHITRSSFNPDYYASEIEEKEWTWFIFPWNVYEDMGNLVLKVLTQEMETALIEKKLEDNFGLVLESGHLDSILNDLVAAKKIEKPSSGLFGPPY